MAVVLAAGVAAGAAVLTGAAAPAGGGAGRSGLDPGILAIMDKPAYKYAQWGLVEVSSTGQVIHSLFPSQFFIPGSTAKLVSESAAWNVLGPDHRFVTPVYAIGQRSGSTLTGNLALVGQGDQSLGGRTTPGGGVAYANIDHADANSVPGATLTPQNPLAGLDQLAAQVRRAGIRSVRGNVIVDDRLFGVSSMDPTPYPVMINDDLIDLLTSPGKAAGSPAKLFWRPKVAPYHVVSSVRTVAPGGTTSIQVSTSPDGTQISLSGTIAANAQPVLQVSGITNPATFARTAFIEALARAGVNVTAPAVGSNPSSALPASYSGDPRVAAYTSPPYADYAKFILKVSSNIGANLAICQLAVTAGSNDCTAGFAVIQSFLQRIGVDPGQVELADGRGGDPVDRVTPQVAVALLRYWLTTPDATQFRLSLPILGVDGSLYNSCTTCAAKGKVFAKTGTFIAADYLNNRLSVTAKALSGYLDAGGGRFDTFFLVTNGAVASDLDGALAIGDDLADIAAILQEDATGGH